MMENVEAIKLKEVKVGETDSPIFITSQGAFILMYRNQAGEWKPVEVER